MAKPDADESGNPNPQTYIDGRPYRPPAGRRAPVDAVNDYTAQSHSVVSGKPSSDEFLRLIQRELKIRFFTINTVKGYVGATRRFLNWFGRLPHQVKREDVREYLEVLVDGGASSSHVGTTLSSLRTVFDKMCCRRTTLGLVTPRKPKRQPVVLNQTEVRLMLEAARSLRDKLLMSLMYGVGLRVSEVSRLRWSELDFERKSVRVFQGKGRKDRTVVLPVTLIPLLQSVMAAMPASEYVFPSEGRRHGRHISVRTVQRAVKSAADQAGICKNVTAHSLRHSFATHLIEDGMDIRFIQRLLGHAKLETTTIYTQVAVLKEKELRSPLDQLPGVGDNASDRPASVGTMRLHLDFPLPAEAASTQNPPPRSATATVVILNADQQVQLDGIVLRESRPGWIAMDVPPEEQWATHLSQLPMDQQTRIRSPRFLDHLKTQLASRFMAGTSRQARVG